MDRELWPERFVGPPKWVLLLFLQLLGMAGIFALMDLVSCDKTAEVLPKTLKHVKYVCFKVRLS